MDPRTTWFTEQIGPAHRHWLRLWESSGLQPADSPHNSSPAIPTATTTTTMRNDAVPHHGGRSLKDDRNGNQRDNGQEQQEDYLSLTSTGSSSQQSTWTRRANERNRSAHGLDDRDDCNHLHKNKASTYGFNRLSHLEILEKQQCMPWFKRKVMCWQHSDHQQDEKNDDDVDADLDRTTPAIIRLHDEIKDFCDYVYPTDAEQNMRNGVVKRISGVIHELWDRAHVEVFGSFRNDLFLPTGDIDMVVFGKWPGLPLTTLEAELVSRGIADRSSLQVISTALVPIIKMVDKQTEVRVDICFNQDGGIRVVKVIKDYLNLYPNLRYLVLVLKQFLLQRDLNEVYTGGISSHCLVFLVISFLQLHPTYDATNPNINLGVLLIEFFELYGCTFNYNKVGIRIRDGGSLVPKQHLKNLSRGTAPGYLYVEDPLNADNDLGRSSYGAYNVKQAFEYAYHVLRNSQNSAYAGQSVLGRIIRVTDDVVEYRAWVSKHFSPVHPLQDEGLLILRGEPARGDNSRSNRTPTHKSVQQHSNKSYAKAVTMNSQSKRMMAGDSANHMRGTHSIGDSDLSTDMSSTSPYSSPFMSASSSSSLASDSDNDSLIAAHDRNKVANKPPAVESSPKKVQKSVSVSALSASCDLVDTHKSSARGSQSHGSLASQNGGSMSHTSKGTHGSSNCQGKGAASKHSFPRIVHNNSKGQTGGNSSSQPSTSQHNHMHSHTANPEPKNRSSHKQGGGKRRKPNVPSNSKEPGGGRSSGNASR